jgi:hypothetical protein
MSANLDGTLACLGYSILILKYFIFFEQFCNFCMFWSYSCILFFTAGNLLLKRNKNCRARSFHTCSGFCVTKLKLELGNKTHLFQCLLFYLTACSAAGQIYSPYEHSIQSSLSGSRIRSIQSGGFSSVYCRLNSNIINTFM